MFTKEFEKKAKIIKKADGPVLNTGAANAFSAGLKGATGAAGMSNTLGKIKGMFGMGGGAQNVAPKG